MASITSPRVYAAWLILVGLTIGSWTISFNRGSPEDGQAWVPIAIFALAAFKIRLLGMYFMELRDAPLPLRGAFEVFSLALFAVLTSFYFLG